MSMAKTDAALRRYLQQRKYMQWGSAPTIIPRNGVPVESDKKTPKMTQRELYQRCLSLALMLGEGWDEDVLDDAITEGIDPEQLYTVCAADLIREGYIRCRYEVTQKGLDKIAEQPKRRIKK
jgi:hypothetical protein